MIFKLQFKKKLKIDIDKILIFVILNYLTFTFFNCTIIINIKYFKVSPEYILVFFCLVLTLNI